jgi:hypothetical protein
MVNVSVVNVSTACTVSIFEPLCLSRVHAQPQTRKSTYGEGGAVQKLLCAKGIGRVMCHDMCSRGSSPRTSARADKRTRKTRTDETSYMHRPAACSLLPSRTARGGPCAKGPPRIRTGRGRRGQRTHILRHLCTPTCPVSHSIVQRSTSATSVYTNMSRQAVYA